MNNKQTAIEWLAEQLKPSITLQTKYIDEYVEQAIQMDKEQKQEFYNEGKDFSQYTHDEQYGGVEYWDKEPLGFEDYYNKQYGK